MSAPSESGGGGSEFGRRIKEHYQESFGAIGGGLADTTYRPVIGVLKDTAKGVGNVLGGLLMEPLRGVSKGLEQLVQLHPGKAVLDIMKGVRDGVGRIFGKGILDTAENLVGRVGQVGAGLIRTTGGVTGLTGFGGDINQLGGGGEPAPTH